jgi:sugar phosphate isomerase/epimerase
MKLKQVAAQLYTLREHLKTPKDIAASLKKVKQIGYPAVQVSGMGPIPEEELNKILDGEGLTCCATHEGGNVILGEPMKVVERLKKLRCKHTAYPYPGGVDFASEASVMQMIQGLDRAGKVLAENGLVLSYHNHNHEFRRLGGKTILDLVYEKTNPRHVQGEIDTYWVQCGGGDPVEWCRKLKGRLPCLHMKDFATSHENKPVFAEIGNGNLRWKEIVAAAEASGCEWFIVEQDVCPGDPFDSLRQSFDFIKAKLVS